MAFPRANATSGTTKPQITLSRFFWLQLSLSFGVALLSIADSIPPSASIERIATVTLEITGLACFSIGVVWMADVFSRRFPREQFFSLGILSGAGIFVESTRIAAREFWRQFEFELPSVTTWAISPTITILMVILLVIAIGREWMFSPDLARKAPRFVLKLGVACTAWHVGAIFAPAVMVLKNGLLH